jgi:hypothetical protein
MGLFLMEAKADMSEDPMEEQRRRDDEERRERDRADRERDRADRERDRERRHEERRARHEARHQFRFGKRGFNVDVEIDPDDIARSVSAAFVGVDDDVGEAFDETVERVFTVDGMPRLRVRNVSGETRIHVGETGQVRVIARKRVRGGSSDRAKRLLENVELRIEQRGNEIVVEPHLYEQERSWLDLFRGKRFRVDFEITLPRESAVDAQTVSGDLEVEGTRGPARLESVSGDVSVADVQGPMRLKSVSGDVECTDYVGIVAGSSVSGDVDIHGRVRGIELHTVSGDISVDVEPGVAPRDNRIKTISGDVQLGLVGDSCTCEFRTASGDLACEVPARIVREGRKDRTIVLGDGQGRLNVRTVSGDLTIKASAPGVAAEPVATEQRDAQTEETPAAPDVERTEPMERPASARVREVLERLARGELNVEEAAAQLDEARQD